MGSAVLCGEGQAESGGLRGTLPPAPLCSKAAQLIFVHLQILAKVRHASSV